MAMKTLDGTMLTRHLKDGFKNGPSREFILGCVEAFFNGKPVDICLFGTTAGAKSYADYCIRITAITAHDSEKDMCRIEGVYDYSSRGGFRLLNGKRIGFVYNMHTRIATHVYSEGW